MIHALSTIDIEILDTAINALQRARQARAEFLACVEFQPGEQVKWFAYQNQGEHTGTYLQPDTKPGFMQINNVKDGFKASVNSSIYIVDAAKVKRVIATLPNLDEFPQSQNQ